MKKQQELVLCEGFRLKETPDHHSSLKVCDKRFECKRHTKWARDTQAPWVQGLCGFNDYEGLVPA